MDRRNAAANLNIVPAGRSRSAAAVQASGSPRVLLIRPTALGDVARTVPALVTLRQSMPDATIDWLVADTCLDAIRHHPALDAAVLFPRKEFGRLFTSLAVAKQFRRWCGSLRDRQYDMVIDLQGLFRSGYFTRATKAPKRIGFANAAEWAWLGYNRRHHVDRDLHTVDRMLALLAAEGFTPQTDMRLYIGDSERRWVDSLLADDGDPADVVDAIDTADTADTTGPTAPTATDATTGATDTTGIALPGSSRRIDRPAYSVIAPTARWLSKTWPIERFVEIAKRMLAADWAGDRLIVLTSPAERDAIRPHFDAFESGRVILPVTNVAQMMAVLDGANMVVCNDSGPLHLAVGLGTPVVAVFGPTDPSLVGPYQMDDAVVRPAAAIHLRGNHHRRNPDDQSLIAQVEVDDVWACILRQRAAAHTRPQASPTSLASQPVGSDAAS